MRLLVVSQYFWPENFRINDLAVEMVRRGHDVTVLTGEPNYPAGKFYEGYGWWRKRREQHEGVTIVRVPLIPRGRSGIIQMMLNYLSFAITGTLGAWFSLKGPFDAIFTFEVSPVTVGIPAVAASRRFKAPMFFWVLDLWPESIKAGSEIDSSFFLNLVDKLVGWIYRNSARVLVQSRAFVPEVAKHVLESKIFYFPNWGEALFQPLEKPDLSLLPKLPEGFKILFAGNIAETQDFPSVLRAAELVKGRKDIHWLIVGHGRKAAWAQEEARKRGLTQVHFLGQYPLELMPHFYAAADALLMPLKQVRIFALTVPGKLQSYLASGKPVLAMVDGEGAKIVTEAGAGLACPAGDAEGLAKNVLELAAMPEEERREMGRLGLAYSQANFDRTSLFNMLEGWFKGFAVKKETT